MSSQAEHSVDSITRGALREGASPFQEYDSHPDADLAGVAFKLGAKSDDPLAMYLNDIYTVSANLAGVPAVIV